MQTHDLEKAIESTDSVLNHLDDFNCEVRAARGSAEAESEDDDEDFSNFDGLSDEGESIFAEVSDLRIRMVSLLSDAKDV